MGHRFFAISRAFTLGHSIALPTDAYQLVNIPARLAEVLIALSIVVALRTR